MLQSLQHLPLHPHLQGVAVEAEHGELHNPLHRFSLTLLEDRLLWWTQHHPPLWLLVKA
jgi:hypothetical protein